MNDSLRVELVNTVMKQLLDSDEIIIIIIAICIIPSIIGFKMLWNTFKGSKSKNATSTVNVNTSQYEDKVCSHHNMFTDAIKTFGERIHDMKSSIDELSLWMQKRESETVTDMKRKTIMRSKVIDVLKMFWDAAIKEFAVAKASIFIKFTLENQDILKQENGYELFKQMFENEGKGVYDLAVKIIGKKRAKEFYDECHNESISDYLKNIKKIYKDETNDKTNRYFNQSILFMQEFLSHLNKIQESKPSGYIKSNSDDILKEFKKLEDKFINLKDSINE